MDRESILDEIRRTAAANGGVPLGWRRFEQESGIGYYAWFGKHWSKWNDAIREAGLQPNSMTEAYESEFMIQQLVALTRRLGRLPTQGDLRMENKSNSSFPSEKAFRRLGSKAERALLIVSHCQSNPGNEDVSAIWQSVPATGKSSEHAEDRDHHPSIGYVYLIKHGNRREYKIGRTNNPLRREGELGIQLPERCEPVHFIKTDDPAGVEAYWHRRFADRRKAGEWFALTAQDVRAFKRWQRIY